MLTFILWQPTEPTNIALSLHSRLLYTVSSASLFPRRQSVVRDVDVKPTDGGGATEGCEAAMVVVVIVVVAVVVHELVSAALTRA